MAVFDPVAVSRLLSGRRMLDYVDRVDLQIAQAAARRVGVKTGRLRASIRHRPAQSDPSGGVRGGVVANTEYALAHHEGTRPHRISPRNARVLRFKVGSSTVFAAQVQHPGTRPNRFLVDGAESLGLKVRRTRGGGRIR